ncbi:MAG TPA: hypothetical protein VE134_05280, partial [Methanomicrobiales archaeon]|nr:hypothetical protein [Methanomicrobiales archaeon]
TPYWVLGTWMFINGFGSGLFQAPNSSAIFGSVPPHRRGITSSIRALFGNVGMLFSMAFAMPLLAGSVTMDEMMEMFVVGGTNMPLEIQQAVTGAIALALFISSALTVPAIIVSALRGEDIRHEDLAAEPAATG